MKKINLSFFILMVFFTQVIITDIIMFIFKIDNYVLVNFFALCINILVSFIFLKKKWIKIEISCNKWDLVFLLCLSCIMFLTISVPDESWDTYSYHIYLQEEPFKDKINEDFFPGRTLTSFISPIADRVFYIFRFLLGFRLGTLPSYLLLIVLFYQVKKFLKLMLKEKISDKYISLFSIFPIATQIILQQAGMYYIDNFCIVFLLEIVYILFTEKDTIFENRIALYFLGLISGIAISIKITNIIYLSLPFIYIFIRNFKKILKIKWYDYIVFLGLMIIPIFPYMMDSLLQTGSPVFPYYNVLFKSEYFKNENWLDTRFGPKSFNEFILWPIYIMKYAGRAYESNYTDIAFPVGYILSILYLLYSIYKKYIKNKIINKDMILYTGLLLCYYFLWEKFIIGYTRYAGIIIVLSLILTIRFFVYFIENKRLIISMFLSFILLFSIYYGLYKGQNVIFKVLDIDKNTLENICKNYTQVFIDKKTPKYDIDGIWGVIHDDSAIPQFLNIDDKIVHLEYGFKTGESEKADEIYWNNVLNNDIYVPLYTFKLNDKIITLTKFYFEIIEIKDVLTDMACIGLNNPVYITKVKYNKEITLEDNKNKFEELLSIKNEEIKKEVKNE